MTSGNARASLALLMVLAIGCAHGEGGLPFSEPPEPPVITLSSVVPVDASLFEARVRVDLRVQNPNDFPVTFDGVRFDLEVNDQPFLSGVSDQRITLPRLGERVVSVEGTTATLDLWRQLRSLASDPGAGVGYRLEGRVFVIEPRRMGVDFESSGGIGQRDASP